MSKASLWSKLKVKGLSDNAVAAIMGNMEAESNCCCYRLQGDFSSGFTKSKQYTEQVDGRTISRNEFTHHGPNGGGYGACQWTYPTRKEGLYDKAAALGRSVGDEDVAVSWLWDELHQGEYAAVLRSLTGSGTVSEMSDVFIKQFEKPADQSVSACARRAALGMEIYREFAGTATGAISDGVAASEEAETVTAGVPDAPETPFWPPRVICKGMTGSDVAVLQALLVAHGYNAGELDGQFGTRTHNMLMGYQTEKGLDADGIAGPKTWRSLGVSV